jgi:hypothetical protein
MTRSVSAIIRIVDVIGSTTEGKSKVTPDLAQLEGDFQSYINIAVRS